MPDSWIPWAMAVLQPPTLPCQRREDHRTDLQIARCISTVVIVSYHEGWVACTTPATLPWELSTGPPPDVTTGYKWELYNVAEDPTQSNDLAAKMPEKLKQLQSIFYREAQKHDVLPLDNSSLSRWNTPRPNLTGGRTVFTYSG
jgi:hypothetical protein